MAAVLLAVIYNIWWARNCCRIKLIVVRPEMIVNRIRSTIQFRLRKLTSSPMSWVGSG
ncbi:hypothetical protein RND81_13G159600 [Saponaria officinalis]|uniref:Uncharacterized protein n=1 Tax=Saponaria officinalis TaxID=3572 RepID=A0AAW1H6G0_SAPOF